LAFLDKNI